MIDPTPLPNPFVTKEGIEVKPRQIWRDLDKRMSGRAVEIVSLGNMTFAGKVRVRSAVSRTGTERWLSVSRMHKHSTGWVLVRDADGAAVQ